MYLVKCTSFCEYSVLRIFTSHVQFIKNVYYIKFVILPVQILHKFEMNMYALIFGLSVTHTRYVYTQKKKREKDSFLFQYVVKEIPSILKHFL